jgi:hypothetical protein
LTRLSNGEIAKAHALNSSPYYESPSYRHWLASQLINSRHIVMGEKNYGVSRFKKSAGAASIHPSYNIRKALLSPSVESRGEPLHRV